MSWRWYKQVALPEGTVTMDVQDFVDVWARHPKEYWDTAVDFPDLTLRSPIFLVAAAPKTFYSETLGPQPWPHWSPRRWGVLFKHRGDHPPAGEALRFCTSQHKLVRLRAHHPD